jgi:hypothetical protein
LTVARSAHRPSQSKNEFPFLPSVQFSSVQFRSCDFKTISSPTSHINISTYQHINPFHPSPIQPKPEPSLFSLSLFRIFAFFARNPIWYLTPRWSINDTHDILTMTLSESAASRCNVAGTKLRSKRDSLFSDLIRSDLICNPATAQNFLTTRSRFLTGTAFGSQNLHFRTFARRATRERRCSNRPEALPNGESCASLLLLAPNCRTAELPTSAARSLPQQKDEICGPAINGQTAPPIRKHRISDQSIGIDGRLQRRREIRPPDGGVTMGVNNTIFVNRSVNRCFRIIFL